MQTPQSESTPESEGSGPSKSSRTSPHDSYAPRKTGPISCAECRRSKLKCDRRTPCSSCIRRGCAALCPDGVLNATKGNKVLQSRAQTLGEQVNSMSAKIKELESALAAAHLQLRVGTEPPEESQGRDPSTRTGVRRRSYGDGTGSLAIDQDGMSRYYGDTAASEYLAGLIPGDSLCAVQDLPDTRELGLPPEVIELFTAFPFGLRDRSYSKALFLLFVPTLERATELAEYYYQRFGWMYNIITRQDLDKEILDHIYRDPDCPTLNDIHPHRLAIFFSVMAIGVTRSFEHNATHQAERYHILAAAAISLAPIVREAMSATIQALLCINAFLFSRAHGIASEETWLLIGICGRLCFRVGLHRDGAEFNLGKDEIQRRRMLFWELYSWDAWLSFSTGRSPSIHLPDTDTKFPEEEYDSGLEGFHSWKFRYSAACIWPTLRNSSAKVASYQATMALDRKIRSFPIPVHLQPPLQGFENRTWSKDPASAMQQYALIVEREMNLLFLHRNYLAVAIKMQTQNPLAHKFGGSVIATFRSVSRMCLALKDLYYLHPKPIGHIWLFWSGIFSACVVFSALVIKSPGCPLAEAALTEFSSACSLFEEGAEPCRHPKAMLLLNHLKRRAEDSYSTYLASPENHAKQLYLGRLAGHMDELNILGGLQGVIRHSSRFSLDSLVSIPSRTSNVRTQLAHEELPVPSNEGAYEGPSSQFTDMPRPFDITTMDCFGLADMGYQDPSPPGLPTYEQIMNADPTQTYTPSWQPSSQAVGHAVPSAESLGVEFTGGGFEQYADAQMTASLTGNEGESIWRSFLEGLMNESPEILQNFPF